MEGLLFAGRKLRELREQTGLTLRDVEVASTILAETRGTEEFIINPSRLSDIETKGVTPSIYRLYGLSVIYRSNFIRLLRLYGIDLSATTADLAVCHPARTHLLEITPDQGSVNIPVKLDPGFDLGATTNIGRMIEKWGVVPFQYLRELAQRKYTFAYIGAQDLTMYPLLLPGSFVQIDEERNRVVEGRWQSEFGRPIYLVETRDSHTCCWCSLRKGEITLQSHPLSPVSPRVLKHPQEAEVIGQVVGIAMRLGEPYPSNTPETQPIRESSEDEPKEARHH